MNKTALIIFVKNPELGKAKTRLAATVGNENALIIYKKLLEHTANITKKIEADKFVFYSQFIANNDWFDEDKFIKKKQIAGDLGKKLICAFEEVSSLGYEKILVVGSDCYELQQNTVEDAIAALDEKDSCIGPAKDGGYYLLGIKNFDSSIFKNITWSTSTVLTETVAKIKLLNQSYALLETLQDVDTENELGELAQFITQNN